MFANNAATVGIQVRRISTILRDTRVKFLHEKGVDESDKERLTKKRERIRPLIKISMYFKAEKYN